MNIATTKGTARHSLSLPNILTYGRIAAIPVVVGCVFAQSVMDGPLWLRWLALAVFIAAGITDYLDGDYPRIWHQRSASGRRLYPIADSRLGRGSAVAGRGTGTVAPRAPGRLRRCRDLTVT